MNLTLYSVLGGLLLSVAAFFYGQHVGTTSGDLKLAQEQDNEYQSYLAYDKAIDTASGLASAKAGQDQYKYQADLAAANKRAADADATSSQLQHAFSLYANGGWFKAPGKDSATVPLSDANAAIGRLADGARTLDADGLGASKKVAACAVRLTACERWKDTVEAEFPKQW